MSNRLTTDCCHVKSASQGSARGWDTVTEDITPSARSLSPRDPVQPAAAALPLDEFVLSRTLHTAARTPRDYVEIRACLRT